MSCHERAFISKLTYAFLFVALLGPWKAAAAVAPVHVNIGTASVTSSALSLWIAQERGFFNKYGIDAQIILMPGGPTLVSSLVAGEIHPGFTTGVSVLCAAAQGTELKMLSSIPSRLTGD